MIFWTTYHPGDWVRTRRQVKQTISDHLGGTGIPEGSRGVVVATTWTRVEVEIDDGLGTTRIDVSPIDLRLIRRDGGVDRFRRRAHRMMILRLGCLLVFVLPVVWYAAQYRWYYRSFDGFVPSLAVGALDGIGDFILAALNDPVRALLLIVVTAVIGRLAFGKR